MSSTRLIMFALCFVVSLLASPALMGQQEPTAKPAPTGIALQVKFDKDAPLGYQSVPGPDAEPRGGWYARFGRINAWQAPAGSLPVMAVNLLSRMEGDAVRIKVSVFTGQEFHDREEPVGTYLVRMNDKLVVSDLAQFGVEPFEITVLRVTPALPAPPEIVNQTQSLAVISVETNNSTTLPSYKLSLRNVAAKDISAFFIQGFNGKVARLSSMQQGVEGQALIKAGDVFELSHPSIIRDRFVDSQEPEAVTSQRIIIRTVMFSDGTYEGDAKYAAEFRAFSTGRKIQVARLAQIFRGAAKERGADTATALEKLRAQVSALGVDIKQSAVDELARDFPELGPDASNMMRSWIEVALHGLRRNTLAEIDAYQRSIEQKTVVRDFHAWLAVNVERYSGWLARLH